MGKRGLASVVAAALLGLLPACRHSGAVALTNIGAGVSVAGTTNLRLKALRIADPGDVVPGLSALSPVFDIRANHQPTGGVTLRLPTSRGLRADEVPVVMTARQRTGPWEAVPTQAKLVDGTVVATVSHFSFFTTLRISVRDLLREAKRLVDDATGGFAAEAPQPQCGGENEVRAAWSITSSSGPLIKWCFGQEGGAPILRVVNGARYPVIAAHPGLGLSAQQVSGTDLGWLARIFSGDRAVLLPRSQATLGPTGSSGRVATEFDGVAQSFFQLQVGIETAISILSRLGGGGPSQFVNVIEKIYSKGKCAATIASPTGGSILSNCLGPKAMLAAFGWKGALIAPLLVAGPLIEFFHSSFNAIGDLIRGRDHYGIQIDRRPPTPSVPGTAPTTIRRPLPAPTPTPPPPGPSSHPPLPGPTDIRVVGNQALYCQDVPPPPNGSSGGRYGRMCYMDYRAIQHAARPDGSGERVMTDFISCGPGETPKPETSQGATEASFWMCGPSSWMSAEDHSNHVGEVRGQVAFEANKRNCYFAFSRLERFDGTFWRSEYVSDTITDIICMTVDGNGQVVG